MMIRLVNIFESVYMVSRLQRLKWAQQGLVAGLILLVVQGVMAAEDLPGSSDLERIKRYPNSWIVDYSQGITPEYRLATGSMKKINGVFSPEQEQYLAGMLTRITYQLPSGHSSVDAFNHFKRQFDRLSPELLFRCEARGCGDSNQWANVQFGIARLYGIDREQYYQALKLPDSGIEPAGYLAFYTVMRGNKRVYVQLDLLQPDQTSDTRATASFMADLEQGRRVFRQILTVEEIRALQQRMLGQPTLHLSLVGHSDQGKSMESTRAASLKSAETLKQKLLEQGLEASRISVYGVGAFAPAYDTSVPNQRVELLLHAR